MNRGRLTLKIAIAFVAAAIFTAGCVNTMAGLLKLPGSPELHELALLYLSLFTFFWTILEVNQC